MIDEQGKKREVYGIDAVAGGAVIVSVENIFCKRHKAEKLAQDCNKFGVDEVHLIDIICDRLE